MANTFTLRKAPSFQQGLLVMGQLTLSGNYATGGEDISDSFKVSGVHSLADPEFVVASTITPYKIDWNASAKKLLVIDLATQAELPAAAYPAGLTAEPVEILAVIPKA